MVLVYSEDKDITLELLSKGSELTESLDEELSAVLIGEDDPDQYIRHGADNVFVVKTDQETFKAEEYSDILVELMKEGEDEVLLLGADKNGQELAPRVASKLDTGCVSECTALYVENEDIITERVIYSGKALAVERFDSKPAVVTVPPKLFDPLPEDEERSGELIEKEIEVSPYPSKIVDIKEKESVGVDVESAETIVSCGRGFDNKEDIEIAQELANNFEGNAVGCSRPISADLNWLPEEHWIGLSGHKVKPRLYIAVGISGQIQHIAGIRDSDIILAINKDEDALIFESADYGIVGDLYEVLPKLIEAVKEKKT